MLKFTGDFFCVWIIDTCFASFLWLWLMVVSEFRLAAFFSFFMQMKFILSLFVLVIILSLSFCALYLTVAWKGWFAIPSFFTDFISRTIFKFVSSHYSSDHFPRESSDCRKWADIIDSNVEACHWNGNLKILSRAISVIHACNSPHIILQECMNTGQCFIIKKMRHFINVVLSNKSCCHSVALSVLKSSIF